MTEVIRIEDYADRAETVVPLRGKRSARVRRPRLRVESQPVWPARRPGWGNARAAANVILVQACDGSLGAAEVQALSEPDRHRLMVAVVALIDAERDWRGLYGTSLNRNERFLAATIWAEQREALRGLEAIRTRLIAARHAPAVAAMPVHINSLAKQIRTMNSLSRFAMSPGLAGNIKSLGIGHRLGGMGLGNAMKSALDAAPSTKILECSKVSVRGVGGSVIDPNLTALTKLWASGFAGAQLRAEMPRITAQMGALSLGKEIFGNQLARNWTMGMSTLSVAKPLGFGSPGYRGALTNLNMSALLGSDLRRPLAGFDISKFGLSSGFLRHTWKTVESLMAAEMARLWSRDPLWFLISHLSPRRVPALLKQTREEVYEAVLDGLEATVRNSDLAEELLDACDEIGFLSPEQREWLRHGLGHAREGDWLQAMPPLTWGFEGAIFNGAVAAKAIPLREGKKLGAETIIKAMQFEEELEAFAIRLVFGGPGNAFRHGRPENEARDQALLQIVALIGWVDSTVGTEGTARLAHGLEVPLAAALEAGTPRELTAA